MRVMVTRKCFECQRMGTDSPLCGVCGITQDGERERFVRKTRTNIERVREMDYDALALLLSDIADGYFGPVSEDICAECNEASCTPCWELWLRKEAGNA